MNTYDIIKRPLVTEKVLAAPKGENNRYAFVVSVAAGKKEIRSAVEKLFNVHVKKINTAIVRGKVKKVGRSMGQRSNWKKALVELKAGEKIEIFEGV